jgi:hypothetical protein
MWAGVTTHILVLVLILFFFLLPTQSQLELSSLLRACALRPHHPTCFFFFFLLPLLCCNFIRSCDGMSSRSRVCIVQLELFHAARGYSPTSSEPIPGRVFWGNLIKQWDQAIKSSTQECLQQLWMFHCIKNNLPQNILNLVEKGWAFTTKSLPDL